MQQFGRRNMSLSNPKAQGTPSLVVFDIFEDRVTICTQRIVGESSSSSDLFGQCFSRQCGATMHGSDEASFREVCIDEPLAVKQRIIVELQRRVCEPLQRVAGGEELRSGAAAEASA